MGQLQLQIVIKSKKSDIRKQTEPSVVITERVDTEREDGCDNEA